MKFTLLLWILPSISAYLFSIDDQTKECGVKPEKVIDDVFTRFFGIPAKNDEEDDFEAINVTTGSTITQLKLPDNEKIKYTTIGKADNPKICYTSETKPTVNGVIYFVEEVYADMDVYQSRGNNYTVEVSKNYTTVFSRDSTGSTLGILNADKDTSFEIHSGLPGDNDNLIFQYDSSQKVDQLYIAQNYFYVLNSGKPFSFTVSDKIGDFPVDPSTTTFGLNGFIMSPNFPATPPDNYEDLKVALKTREVEKILKLKVTTIQSSDAVKTGEEGIVLDEEPSVYVKIGDFDSNIPTEAKIRTTPFDVPLPTTANTIEIKSVNSAYTVQFDIEDVPTSTTATPSSTTTVTPKPVTSGTCPPTTCPVVTCPVSTPSTCPNVTCPVSTPCSCLTTTTELSTTTMGASTLSVASIITIFLVYSLF
ncbi:hypothetical protein CRE_12503 [Caenorhabditis remanei]|uniref:Uncharacterized protein n=1 Tax=Caenorhabditis remanei TaxID=31234 RepID=E3M7A4_CAERE|nr:hypothetical protein CRE_12503 [Caenorhabditis remanei]